MHNHFSHSRLTASVSALALLAWAGVASATTITFTTALTIGPSYSEAGFDFTGTGGDGVIYSGLSTFDCNPKSCADNGTPYMMTWSGFGAPRSTHADTIVMKAADGSLFQLNSFDGAEAPFSGVENGNWASAISVTGVLADNSTMSQSFNLDQINDGQAGAVDFQSFTANLSGAFKELRFSGVQGNGRDFAIDNITVSAASVPEPSSLALVALALVGLGTRGRRAMASKR